MQTQKQHSNLTMHARSRLMSITVCKEAAKLLESGFQGSSSHRQGSRHAPNILLPILHLLGVQLFILAKRLSSGISHTRAVHVVSPYKGQIRFRCLLYAHSGSGLRQFLGRARAGGVPHLVFLRPALDVSGHVLDENFMTVLCPCFTLQVVHTS